VKFICNPFSPCVLGYLTLGRLYSVCRYAKRCAHINFSVGPRLFA